MIDYTTIRNTLDLLEDKYNKSIMSVDVQIPILYSKLAVLELSGWLEMSIDELLNKYVHICISDKECEKYIKGCIKRTHGFDYETNLKGLFSSVFGIKNLQQIITNLSTINLNNLKSITQAYTELRNRAAHTYVTVGATLTYNAPSQVLLDYQKLELSIKNLELEINKL